MRKLYFTEQYEDFMQMLNQMPEMPDPSLGLAQLRGILCQTYNPAELLGEFDRLFAEFGDPTHGQDPSTMPPPSSMAPVPPYHHQQQQQQQQQQLYALPPMDPSMMMGGLPYAGYGINGGAIGGAPEQPMPPYNAAATAGMAQYSSHPPPPHPGAAMGHYGGGGYPPHMYPAPPQQPYDLHHGAAAQQLWDGGTVGGAEYGVGIPTHVIR